MYQEYAKDPRARLNLGIRRRLAPLVDNDRRQMELLYGLLFTLPGSPVLYYGDEIGMGDNIYLGDRQGVRTPRQWTGDRNAGFSRADPSRLYQQVLLDPIYHYQAINVEAQLRAPTAFRAAVTVPSVEPPSASTIRASREGQHAARPSSTARTTRPTVAVWL